MMPRTEAIRGVRGYGWAVPIEHPTHAEVVEATAATEAVMRTQTPPVNVFETTGAVVIVAALPAVSASDVTIELRRSTLRFWAHLRSAAPRAYLMREWVYGGYEREINLPDGFGSAVEATLGKGQLAIRVLRGEPAELISVKPSVLYG